MKKFGFGKKDKKGAAAQDENPYAQQPAQDAYSAPATPYQQARTNVQAGGGAGGLPGGPRVNSYGSAPPAYSSNGDDDQKPMGYGNEKLGATGGYGGNRYDSSGGYGSQASSGGYGGAAARGGGGGYGGMGGGRDDDNNRNNLLAGGRERAADRPAAGGYGQSSQSGGGSGYGQSSSSYGGYDGGYGQTRELTEEEREEQEVNDVKNQIRETKQESNRTLDRTIAVMNQTIDTSLGTYARLGSQTESMYRTEQNLDLASIQNRTAADGTKKLESLNRSMFAVHIANPFTKNQKLAEREKEVLEQGQRDRELRQGTRQAAFQANQRMEQAFRDTTSEMNRPRQLGLSSAGERSKFQFEADEEDEELENGIDNKLQQVSDGVRTLNNIANGMGQELSRQNQMLDRIGEKSDVVDDGLRVNKARLGRIR